MGAALTPSRSGCRRAGEHTRLAGYLSTKDVLHALMVVTAGIHDVQPIETTRV